MKSKKPKPINFVVIAEDDERDLYATLHALVAGYHEDLIGARIALAWRFGWSSDPDGRLQLGQCRKASDLDRLLHDFDFIILLNHEVWHAVNFTEEQKRALLDHELCHARLRFDEDGQPIEDVNGRRAYRVAKHTIEEFHEVVERHGLWKADIASFAMIAMEAKTPPLFSDDPKTTLKRAVADLAPRPGGSIEKVTISSGGKSVSLTQEDGARLRGELSRAARATSIRGGKGIPREGSDV